jgi:type IV pilus assembly protein PilW
MERYPEIRKGGFGLVEIMVGLAMGMVSMLVIMQVFSVFEGGKRTITGGADAQSNGTIALYMIERDTRMAGWGMGTSGYAGCSSTYAYCDGSAACGGSTGALDMSFAPLKIVDGGDRPDSISVQYFADPTLGTFRIPTTTTLRSTMPQSSSELNVQNVSGCNVGGMVLVSQAGRCTLMKITAVQGPALKIQHNPGSHGEFNPPANFQNTNNWPAYSTGATLACFEPASNAGTFRRGYSVDYTSRQLRRTDNSSNAPATGEEVIAPEIVDLQAQYGIAPANDQAVNEWVDAKGATWATPTLDNWKRIKAIRIALVARSTQYEKPDAGTACTTTTSDTVTTWSTWATFDASKYSNDWQCYRYKVFETVVPLRNVMWGNL